MQARTEPWREVRMPAGPHHLVGDLVLPGAATGLVLFAHGSGSGRHSARNRQVARRLQDAGIATLLFDLLTPEEEQVDLHTRQHRFDIPLLTQRLQDATAWAAAEPDLRSLPIGYFGASTGAAAALIAAARLGRRIGALVLRGGRPDLAGPVVLGEVQSPTLLIVGAADPVVLQLNRHACQHLRVEHELRLVPGATHLFEEPGALEQVGDAAAQWFAGHLIDHAQHA
ncbi:dienelactone hydrolase family protein [Ramlibacter tataouinensis]|uniref:dienelactone hydrolase family protein n=1 Tax=Ramlibacter tataouinensis TaxID=94132 RepID=UPI0022F37F70|nr:alpha/beta family hydrolase [Ramlibacter tataouinensis]WBY03308.1 dienelactone hydrolase family protein [Ramlibacter tataouinensis]